MISFRTIHRGFTLIELLIVVAIIALLIALCLPAVQRVREASNRAKCINSSKQIATACHTYHSVMGKLPPAVLMAPGVTTLGTTSVNFGPNWAVMILPQLDQQPLYHSIATSVSNYPKNGDNSWRSIVNQKIPVLLCPSDIGADSPFLLNGQPWARGNYGANTGPGMFWNYEQVQQDTAIAKIGSNNTLTEMVPHFTSGWGYGGLSYAGGGVMTVNGSPKFDEFGDSLSSTIMIDELRIMPDSNDLRGTWALGQGGASISAANGRADGAGPNQSLSGWDDAEGGSDRPDIGMGCCNNCGGNFQVTAKSRHPGGVITAFCDLHVQFVVNSVNTQTWFFLHSRNDTQKIVGEY